MAGYMTKLGSYMYEGELINGTSAAVENGLLFVHGTSTNVGKLVFPSAADTTSKFTCIEVTDLYGIPAYRFSVDKLTANYYISENGYEVNNSEAYDTRTYTTPVGALLRAHPLVVGEEFVTTKVTGTIAKGTQYGVKTDGTIG